MKIVVLGPPGSGKSTQADLIAEEVGVPHIRTGDLFHYLSREATPQGQKIKQIMESGGLIEDEFTLKKVEKRLKEKQYAKGFVLDGTPRSLWQAQHFKMGFDKVFYLQVSDQENIKRLTKRGRADTDKPAVIKKRLAVYHQTTEPMLDFYRQKGVLEEIDGERPIETIFQDMAKKLTR